jgi:hypothetical protein
LHIEQQIPTRPADKERKKMYYLGKKKKHTVKNQITVNNRGFIIHKPGHKKGKRYDYMMFTRRIILLFQNRLLM